MTQCDSPTADGLLEVSADPRACARAPRPSQSAVTSIPIARPLNLGQFFFYYYFFFNITCMFYSCLVEYLHFLQFETHILRQIMDFFFPNEATGKC